MAFNSSETRPVPVTASKTETVSPRSDDQTKNVGGGYYSPSGVTDDFHHANECGRRPDKTPGVPVSACARQLGHVSRMRIDTYDMNESE